MTERDCRACGMRLTLDNARTSRGRWVGLCLSCERHGNVTVRLPTVTLQALKDRAAIEGRSVANMLRRALEHYLDDDPR